MPSEMLPTFDTPLIPRSAAWPAELTPVFEQFVTCEYATLTKAGAPITYPVTPYMGADGQTLDVSTGLTYPSKAERARRNPAVALLYSDPNGSGLTNPPVVLVQGYAAVRDADLQANTDRYLRLSMQKAPEAYKGMPAFMLRRMPWYFARIWIEVTPARILWWPQGDLNRAPLRWEAPADRTYPASDPAPTGKALGAWKEANVDWRTGAGRAVAKFGPPALTVVDQTGFPTPLRVGRASLTPNGFHLEVPAGLPVALQGAACLTFHHHDVPFTRQENVVFVGHVEMGASGALFHVERQLADWSLGDSKLQGLISFFKSGRKVAPRLEAEAARRGQPAPIINLP